MSDARIRWMLSSNIYLCPSGYGTQAASLMPRIAELPELGGEPGSTKGRKNIAQFAWYGLHGTMLNIDGFAIYPGMDDPYGNDVIGRHVRDFGASVLTSLIDLWVLHGTAKAIAPALFLPWFPVDHDPIPQRVLDGLEGAHMPLSYSKWGRDMLNKAGVPNTYIAHGVEPGIYNVQPRERALANKRKITGIDNAFLCVMVAANKGMPDRKWFQGQLRAFKELTKVNPDARLYVHTDPTPAHGGVDFGWLVEHLGIKDKVIFPDRYRNRMGYPQQYLADVYNAADVLMSCSMSEGFGIPIIEAQACGTPAVVTNFSAMPELVRWGYVVDVADMVLTPMNAWQAWPSVTDMTDKLQRLYEQWDACGGDWPIAKRLATSKAIHDEYSWDVIVRDQWGPLMTKLADEAPPLDARFQVQGVDTPPTAQDAPQDDVEGFVDVLNSEAAKAAQSKPQRRVAPIGIRDLTPAEKEAALRHNADVMERAAKRQAAHDAVDLALGEGSA